METAKEVLARLEGIIKITKKDYDNMTMEQWGEAVNVINREANNLRCVESRRN